MTKLQEQAAKRIAKGEKKGPAMIKAGYSPKTANNPSKLTKSKYWQKLMDKHFPDEDLIKIHRELLGAGLVSQQIYEASISNKRIRKIYKDVGFSVLDIIDSTRGTKTKTAIFFMPDSTARDKALDKAYKLTGKYTPEKQKDDYPGLQEKLDLISKMFNRK